MVMIVVRFSAMLVDTHTTGYLHQGCTFSIPVTAIVGGVSRGCNGGALTTVLVLGLHAAAPAAHRHPRQSQGAQAEAAAHNGKLVSAGLVFRVEGDLLSVDGELHSRRIKVCGL